MGSDSSAPRGAELSRRLVTDELWRTVAPLLPSFTSRPQGGGTAPTEARTVFTAVVFVLTSDCAWRHLPRTFGISQATAHRYFLAWTKADLWQQLRQTVLSAGAGTDLEWTLDIVSTALLRAGIQPADPA